MVYLPPSFVFSEKSFKKQTGKEPAGQIVQPDNFFDLPPGAAVIPGTEAFFRKQHAADIFSHKNEKSIGQSSDKGGFVL